jgi:DNA-binding IscR family transcriptional regulator
MKISEEKQKKISEQILAFLYSNMPKPMFTAHIAREIIRDEEFVKKLLLNLRKEGLVNEVKKNSSGKEYLKRLRWKLSDKAYEAYKRAALNF